MTEQQGEQPSVGLTEDQAAEKLLGRMTQRAEQADDSGPADAPAPTDEPETTAGAQDAADESGLTPDDLEDSPAPALGPDEFDLVHKGATKRMKRDEVIALAQQGFDYNVKMQQYNEQRKAVESMAAQTQQMAQLQAAMGPELAQVQALQGALQQYSQIDWVRLASEDPIGYAPKRAEFDQLQFALQRAVGGVQQKAAAIQQQQQQLTATRLQQEYAQLTQRMPAWADGNAYRAAAKEMRTYLISDGYSPEEIDALVDSRMVVTAYKAMKYDQLVKAKAEKLKQVRTAPPVTKPGASGSTQTNQRVRMDELQGRLKKTGDLKDAAALMLQRMRNR